MRGIPFSITLIQIAAALALFLLPLTLVHAQQAGGQGGVQIGGQGGVQIGGQGGAGSRTIMNPAKVQSVAEFVSLLLRAIMAIGVPIAIIFIVLAGFKFIAAQGSPSALAEARQNFVYVIIGIAIFIGASALAQLVVSTLRQVGVSV